MTNKALRILIADERHDQLLRIEKLLNRLDYYRIAPVRTFEELSLLTSAPHESFDLLIVNKALASSYGIDMSKFCRGRRQILHALVYESPAAPLALCLDCLGRSIYTSLTDAPGASELNILLNIIDPPPRWACLKELPWLCEVVRA